MFAGQKLCAGGAWKLLYVCAFAHCKSGAGSVSRRLQVFRFFTGQPRCLPDRNCAPAVHGNCCTYALSRIVSPAQVLFPVVCKSSVFFTGQPQCAADKNCAPAELGNCCTRTLPRAVSPAQVLFSVVCVFYVYQRDNCNLRQIKVVRRQNNEVG